MPFRGFIIAFTMKGQPFLSQSLPGLFPLKVAKSKTGDGTDAIRVAGTVAVRIAVAVHVGEIGCRDDVQRLPQYRLITVLRSFQLWFFQL